MIEHKGTQDILTNRLLLRRFIVSDAQMMFDNWANDDNVTKYLTWSKHKNIEETTSKLNEWVTSYKDMEFYTWAIVLKDSNDVIGSISVVNHSNSVS